MNGWLKKPLAMTATLLLLMGISSGPAQGKPEKVSVVYGGSSWLGHYPAWVGIEKGLFEKYGLEVLFQSFHASSGRMGSLVAGDLDVASTGCISAIALMAAGSRGFMAFGTQDSYATVEGIIAKEAVEGVQDLKGKRIATPFASSAHVLVLDILEQAGLDPEADLSLINLKVNEMPAALRSGEIDACAAWTPHFNKLLNMPGNHLLVNDTQFSLFKAYGIGPGPDLLVVRREFAERYPNTSRAFVDGYFDAVDMLIKKPKACARVLVKLTNLSLADQLAVLRDIRWIRRQDQRAMMIQPGDFVTGMQHLAEFLVRHQQIDEAPQVKEWIAESMVPKGR